MVWTPSYTHKHTGSFVSYTLWNMKKGKKCHNLSFLSWFQCPILIHSWVYRFSLPVYSNLSQLLWLWLLPRPRPSSSLPQVAERRRLASPNKEISPLYKSMLTVCLHRLGHSPTLWILIRHMMRRREIGIWAAARCIGQTDLIVFAFHLPALMETFLIHASYCHPASKPSQVENACISHSYFNKPQQTSYKDGRLYIFFFVDWTGCQQGFFMKTEDDRDIFALCFMK